MSSLEDENSQVVICRACTSECSNFKHIFKCGVIDGEETTLATMLSFCTNLDFEPGQGNLPEYICVECSKALARSFKFKKTVLHSNDLLREQLREFDEVVVVNENESGENDGEGEGDSEEDFIKTEYIEESLDQTSAVGCEEEEEEMEMEMTKLQELANAAEEHSESMGVMEFVTLTVMHENQQADDEAPVYELEMSGSMHRPEELFDDQVEEVELVDVSDMDLYGIQQTSEVGVDEEESQEAQEQDDFEQLEEETIFESINEEEVENSENDEEQLNRIRDSRRIYTSQDDSIDTDGEAKPKILRRTRKSGAKPPNPKYKCQVCGKQLSNNNSFKYHMQLHSDATPFLCSLCGQGFKTRNAYEGHIVIHDPNNPNTCDICGKSYRQNSSLRSHMLTHTGDRPFRCDICGKGLTQKSGYKKHMLTHTGEKPHSCDICGRSFRYSSNLIAHKRGHSDEKPYTCEHCSKSFVSAEQLKRHSIVHSADRPFACGSCGKTFKRRSSLSSHRHTHDGQPSSPMDQKILKSNVVELY